MDDAQEATLAAWSAHAEQQLQRVAEGPAQPQLGPVLQEKSVFAVGPAPELLHSGHVDERRAMPAGVQAGLEVAERLAEEVLLPLDVSLHVVILGPDPLDGVHRDDGDATSAVHREAFHPATRPGLGA